MSVITRTARPVRVFGVIAGYLVGIGLTFGLPAAPLASAEPDRGMVRCFIAHGIVERAAITIGDWQVGKPLIDPPGGIDRDNWFRTYAVCAWMVHRTNIF